jgi:long-chain acyl-CoA synthetase
MVAHLSFITRIFPALFRTENLLYNLLPEIMKKRGHRMRTLITMLHGAAERYGKRTFLSSKTEAGWSPVSFREADTESSTAAAWFLSRKAERGSRAILLAEGRPEWVISEFGMLKAGLISVPLSIKLLAEEVPFRINHSGAAWAVLSRITLPKVLDTWHKLESKPFLILLDPPEDDELHRMEALKIASGTGWITWPDLLKEGASALAKDPELAARSMKKIDENDTVNICYTSGTTGNPKGIMLTHLNYWTNAHDAVTHFNIPEATYETLVILPLDHSFAHTVAIYAAVVRGNTLHFVDARGGSMSILRNIPGNMVETNPTFLLTVPALSGNFMKKIIQGVSQKGPAAEKLFNMGMAAGVALEGDGYHKPGIGTRLRCTPVHALVKAIIFNKVKAIFGNRIDFFVGGGALLEIKQQHFFAALGVPVYQGYGLTEAAPIISSNTPECHKYGTSGKVVPSVTCKIMKSDTEEAAIGEIGEIVIRGDNVMKGYFRNPEASAEALREGWLWTGDLARYDEDGFLVVVGRQKALLISADGEKYPPEEIEEAIANSSDLFTHIMAYNEQRKFTAALVTLNEEACRALFKKEAVETPEAALSLLREHFLRYRSAGVDKKIPTPWAPVLFEIIEEQFSEQNGLVNSTMKMVRHKAADLHRERIEAMYRDEELENPRNLGALKTLFFS